jgi:hypothetical protein
MNATRIAGYNLMKGKQKRGNWLNLQEIDCRWLVIARPGCKPIYNYETFRTLSWSRCLALLWSLTIQFKCICSTLSGNVSVYTANKLVNIFVYVFRRNAIAANR